MIWKKRVKDRVGTKKITDKVRAQCGELFYERAAGKIEESNGEEENETGTEYVYDGRRGKDSGFVRVGQEIRRIVADGSLPLPKPSTKAKETTPVVGCNLGGGNLLHLLKSRPLRGFTKGYQPRR